VANDVELVSTKRQGMVTTLGNERLRAVVGTGRFRQWGFAKPQG
jgi:hypothetical protein